MTIKVNWFHINLKTYVPLNGEFVFIFVLNQIKVGIIDFKLYFQSEKLHLKSNVVYCPEKNAFQYFGTNTAFLAWILLQTTVM